MRGVTRWRLARRELLKRLGAGVACLPLLRATRARGAARAPRRLMMIQMAEGYRQLYWKPAPGSLLDQRLPSTSEPFEPHKADMVFLPDLTNPGTGVRGQGGYGVMFYGRGGVAKGTYMEPAGPTLDEVVATGLPAPATGRTSLHLGVQLERPPRVTSAPGGLYCFWSDAGRPHMPVGDPYAVYADIFGGAPIPTDPKVRRLMIRRKSILDYVGASLDDFGKRLGAEDRGAIGAHLESIRDVERMLQPGPATASCGSTKPSLIDLAAAESYPHILAAHMRLMVEALKCGVTNVATLQTSDAGGTNINFGAFVPGIPPTSKNNYKTPYRNWSDLGHNPVMDGVDHKRIVDRWFMERFAELLVQLKAVPDVGGSLLDSVVVLIGNYMEEGANLNTQKAPWMLAGKCGGYFNAGQCLASGGQSIASVMAGVCEGLGISHPYGAVMPALKR